MSIGIGVFRFPKCKYCVNSLPPENIFSRIDIVIPSVHRKCVLPYIHNSAVLHVIQISTVNMIGNISTKIIARATKTELTRNTSKVFHYTSTVNFYPPPNIPFPLDSRAAVSLCRIKISPAHGFSRAKRPLGGYFFTDTSGTSGTKALLCGTEVPIGVGPCKSLQRTEQINGPLGRAKCSSPCEK